MFDSQNMPLPKQQVEPFCCLYAAGAARNNLFW